jgi:hypothetical protein
LDISSSVLLRARHLFWVALPNAITHDNIRSFILGVMFAFLISPLSVLVLYFGLTGSPGNSLLTGGFLTISTVTVGLLCFRRDIVLVFADYLFVALALCMATSFALNGWTSNAKEYGLLILSLAAYPACRFISRQNIISGNSSFAWTTGTIVLFGTLATATALFQQWNDPHGKPIVFGFDAAATHFLGSLCFLVIALLTTGKLTMRRTAVISSLIFLPVAIFAASMVRLTFIALAGTLCLAAIVSGSKQRKHIIAVTFVILMAVAAGLVARSDKARLYAEYAMEQTSDVKSGSLPSCDRKVNLDNSIAIRKALIQDAVFLIPTAGWIGTGLDSFMKFSCIRLTEVHNSILQAAVEFGWLGGSLLFLIIILAGSLILPLARQDDVSRFVLCSLIFILFLSLTSGRVSRDAILFALLGYAVGLKETARTTVLVPSTMVA